MISWFEEANIYTLSPEEVAKIDPHLWAFWNLNTPAEFEQAESLAKSLG
jgi:RPA family protein